MSESNNRVMLNADSRCLTSRISDRATTEEVSGLSAVGGHDGTARCRPTAFFCRFSIDYRRLSIEKKTRRRDATRAKKSALRLVRYGSREADHSEYLRDTHRGRVLDVISVEPASASCSSARSGAPREVSGGGGSSRHRSFTATRRRPPRRRGSPPLQRQRALRLDPPLRAEERRVTRPRRLRGGANSNVAVTRAPAATVPEAAALRV